MNNVELRYLGNMMKSEYLLGANTGIPDVDGILIHEGDTLIMSEKRLPLHKNRLPKKYRVSYNLSQTGKVVYKDGSFYLKVSQSKYCRLMSSVVRYLGLKAIVSNRHWSKSLVVNPDAIAQFRKDWEEMMKNVNPLSFKVEPTIEGSTPYAPYIAHDDPIQ